MPTHDREPGFGEHGESYGMVLPFDSDDTEFRRGFECGTVWAELNRDDGDREFMVHDGCVEMLMRIAEATSIPFCADLPCDGWALVYFGEAGDRNGVVE